MDLFVEEKVTLYAQKGSFLNFFPKGLVFKSLAVDLFSSDRSR